MRPPTSRQMNGGPRRSVSPASQIGTSLSNHVFEGQDVYGRVFFGRGVGGVPQGLEITAPLDWTGFRFGKNTAFADGQDKFINVFIDGSSGATFFNLNDDGFTPPDIFTFAPAFNGIYETGDFGLLGTDSAPWFIWMSGGAILGPLFDGAIDAGDAGQVLESQGAGGAPLWVDKGGFTGGYSWNRYAAADSYTWTKPAGALFTIVIVIGPGGGGGGADASGAPGQVSAGGGGGAGGLAIAYFSASELGATEAVVVGAGGTAGSNTGGNGGNGGTTTFGASTTLVQATGGTGGTGAASGDTAPNQGGQGGIGSGANPAILSRGPHGGHGITFDDTADDGVGIGGHGGASHMGAGGRGGITDEAGEAGSWPGGGGGGAAEDDTTGQLGGVGADGMVLVLTLVES